MRCPRPSPCPLLLVLTLALAGLVSPTGSAPAAAQDADGEDPTDDTFLQGDDLVVEDPPLKLTRPSDSWQLLNLDALRRKMAERNRALPEELKARMWYGAARANVFVHAFRDPQADPPSEAAAVAAAQIEQLKKVLGAATEVRGPGQVRVGARVGVMFEAHGALAGKPHVIMRAVVVRPDDRQIITLTLECPPDRLKDLRKDWKKLLKKARL